MSEQSKACFYCANTHNFTTEKCKCVCHKVEGLWQRLRVINAEVDWTIPQLIAIQKLIGEYIATEDREPIRENYNDSIKDVDDFNRSTGGGVW